jgi:purine-binding chemotaxis protein CheW
VKSEIQAGGTYLTFRLRDEVFGVEIARVREIVELDGAVTRVPRTPAFMRGVMNLRGQVVPVVDMNAKLGFEPASPTQDTCVIILEVLHEDEPLVLGAMVDAVREVVELSEDEVLAPPPSGTALRPEFLDGLVREGESFVMLISVDAVLAAEELARAAGDGELEQVLA